MRPGARTGWRGGEQGGRNACVLVTHTSTHTTHTESASDPEIKKKK